jgi:hypothetical protein
MNLFSRMVAISLGTAVMMVIATPAHAQYPCGPAGAWNCSSPQTSASPTGTSTPPELHPRTANSCLLVKHKGTTGRRLAWFFLIGVPIAPGSKYDYIDSIDYTTSKMAYGGKDLLSIQASGVHVIVLNEKFTAADLDSARNACISAHR